MKEVCFSLSIGSPLALHYVFYLILPSPTGQQFISCKDVSSYLQSVGGLDTAQQPNGHKGEDIQEYRQKIENVSTYLCCCLVSFKFFTEVYWICRSMQV